MPVTIRLPPSTPGVNQLRARAQSVPKRSGMRGRPAALLGTPWLVTGSQPIGPGRRSALIMLRSVVRFHLAPLRRLHICAEDIFTFGRDGNGGPSRWASGRADQGPQSTGPSVPSAVFRAPAPLGPHSQLRRCGGAGQLAQGLAPAAPAPGGEPRGLAGGFVGGPGLEGVEHPQVAHH